MNLRIVVLGMIMLSSLFSYGQKVIKKDGVYVNAETLKTYSGVYVSYYENGEKESVYLIKNGFEDGKVEFYYNTGEIMEQGTFKSGEKSGKWIRWSK